MFVGRKRELNLLEELYAKPGFSMVVVYGRRRIGKSFLLSKFAEEKRNIFYTASTVGKRRNLELFTRQVMSLIQPELLDASFDHLDTVLDVLDKYVGDEKLILIIDELPYWAKDDESILSILQKQIDTSWLNRNIMLILCGSALSFMENKVLSEKSPLFGRRTAQIKLESLDYFESAEFVQDYSYEDKAITYAVTSGVPKYLSLINPDLTLDDNIVNLFFKSGGYLYEETRNYLAQEFSDVIIANNVIEQIANGENTIKNISDKIRQNQTTVLYTLEKLIETGIVEKKQCIFEENNRRKTQYVLKDTMFKFWFEFVQKALGVIEAGQGKRYYELAVKPKLHSYMGDIFEKMCRYYVLLEGIQGKFGNFITITGSWWGSELIDSKAVPCDIDIVGFSSVDNTAVIGECKFKNEAVGKDVYDTLVRRGRKIEEKVKVIDYLLFSLNGYTSWYDDQNIKTYTLDDLYNLHKND